jgi:hypothetical protein
MRKTALKLFAAGAMLVGAGRALATTHYVDVNSTNATPPYTNWATAAVDIQYAVSAAADGDEIIVTDGFYSPVNMGKLNIRSVNGPQFTTIDGGGTSRCVDFGYAGGNLSGFTLADGHVEDSDDGGGVDRDQFIAGGGAVGGGTLNNCLLVNNSVSFASDGHFTPGTYTVSAYGGGAYGCTLNNCTLIGNSASAAIYDIYGYGIESCYARGGGAYDCQLNNCTLTRNTVSAFAGCYSPGGCMVDSSYAAGAGADGCTLKNCILYFNVPGGNYGAVTMEHCCTTPDPGGFGNITNSPLFVDGSGGNLRIQFNSPCINAGNNAYAPAGTDLDGNPRIVGGTVDIGAYEYQSLSLINFSVVSNQAGFNITGQSNQIVTVETSTDLVNWSPLATNTLNGHPFPFSDPIPASLPQRFYRAQAQ